MRCKNLAGAIEVVLQPYAAKSDARAGVQEVNSPTSASEDDKRQLTARKILLKLNVLIAGKQQVECGGLHYEDEYNSHQLGRPSRLDG